MAIGTPKPELVAAYDPVAKTRVLSHLRRDSLMTKPMSVVALAKQWAVKKRLFGTQALLRYVILTFAECLNQVSDEFIFKGGNLLWVYIATPRAMIDLDLATLQTTSHSKVRKLLERACSHSQEMTFSILEFEKIEKEGHSAAAGVLGYSTQEGASNRFEIDIVYSLKTDHHQIPSPVHPEIMIRAAIPLQTSYSL